jgi:uncharacterized repeat protein (TIGR01451 family)
MARIARDPPNPNITELALPVLRSPPAFVGEPPLSSATVGLVNQHLASRALVNAYLEALQVSSDRYVTALSAGDLASAELQRDAIVAYTETLSQLLASDARVAESLLAALRTDGVPNVPVTPADVVAMQQEIATNGFPAEVLSGLQQFQLSTDELAFLQSLIAAAATPGAPSSFLDDLESDAALSRTTAAALAAVPRTWVSSDLRVAIAGAPDPVTVAEELTYSLAVTNAGPDPATSVTLTDVLPIGASFVSATSSRGSCAFADGIVTCAIGDLAASTPDSSADIVIVLRPSAPGSLTNTAAVASDALDPDGASNTSSLTVAVQEPPVPTAPATPTPVDTPTPTPTLAATTTRTPAPVQTTVCGPIASSTTWTRASSPYQLTCNVTVPAA